MTSRCQATNPVCDATSGPDVIATFFRKSASTPQAMNGIIATKPQRQALRPAALAGTASTSAA